MIKPGIYRGISWDEYRSWELPSPSLLKHGLRSMRRLKRAIDGDMPQPKPEVTAIGNAVHCLISGEFAERCAEMPDFHLDDANLTTGTVKTPPKLMEKKNGTPTAAAEKWFELCSDHGFSGAYLGEIIVGQEKTESKLTKYYQDNVSRFKEQNEGKIILNSGQMGAANKCHLEINSHREAVRAIDGAEHEVSIVAEIEGVLCKTRLDLFKPEQQWAADLKTTTDVESKAFYRKCRQMNYLFQFAFHREILKELGVYLQSYEVIAAETQDDYDVAVYEIMHGDTLDYWGRKVREVVTNYRDCMELRRWPGMYPEVEILHVPEYDMTEQGVDWDSLEDSINES